jgi:hypothetical protein
VLYFLSLSFITRPAISVTILLLGRALLGVGESFIITGAQTWAYFSRAGATDRTSTRFGIDSDAMALVSCA